MEPPAPEPAALPPSAPASSSARSSRAMSWVHMPGSSDLLQPPVLGQQRADPREVGGAERIGHALGHAAQAVERAGDRRVAPLVRPHDPADGGAREARCTGVAEQHPPLQLRREAGIECERLDRGVGIAKGEPEKPAVGSRELILAAARDARLDTLQPAGQVGDLADRGAAARRGGECRHQRHVDRAGAAEPAARRCSPTWSPASRVPTGASAVRLAAARGDRPPRAPRDRRTSAVAQVLRHEQVAGFARAAPRRRRGAAPRPPRPRHPRARSTAARRSIRPRSRAAPAPPPGSPSRRDPPAAARSAARPAGPSARLSPVGSLPAVRRVIEKRHRHRVGEESLRRGRIGRATRVPRPRRAGRDSRARCRRRCRARRRRNRARDRKPGRERRTAPAAGWSPRIRRPGAAPAPSAPAPPRRFRRSAARTGLSRSAVGTAGVTAAGTGRYPGTPGGTGPVAGVPKP